MPKLPSLQQAKALLEAISTAEQAVKLAGPEREAYLKALEVVHGPKEARAAAMGFSPETHYHGTNANFDQFDPKKLGSSTKDAAAKDLFFFSDNPKVAEGYGKNVMPVHLQDTDNVINNSKKFSEDSYAPSIKEAGEMGNTGVTFPQVYDVAGNGDYLKSKVTGVFEPQQIRSTQAAFDPRFKKSGKILAGAAGAALGTAALGNNQAEAGTMAQPSKLFKIGNEIVEAAHYGQAQALKREMVAAGKIAEDAKIAEHLVPVEQNFGKVDLISGQKPQDVFVSGQKPGEKSNFGQVSVVEGQNPSLSGQEEAKFGKVKVVPAVAALGSPMESLRGLGQAWQSNVVDPISGALKNTFTPSIGVSNNTFSTASPVSDAILSTAADPINYVPGGAGAVLGAAQAVSGFADGGEVGGGGAPPDSIPLDQFQAAAPTQAPISSTGNEDVIPIDQFESAEDKYGTGEQMGKTFLEGAAQGIAGPLATLAEKHVLGVNEKDVLGRANTNTLTHGVGEAAGIAGSAMTGVGEGALMAKAGTMAAEAAGLGAAKAATSLGFKVGSEAVKQAAEMSIMSGSDELSKLLLHDPDTSAESALGQIGLGTALGAAGGAAFAGVISPLWKAAVGAPLEKALGTVRGHLDGSALAAMPEEVANATKTLGIELEPVMKAATSGKDNAVEHFNTLKYAQNKEVAAAIDKVHTDVSNSVMDSLGVPLKDMQSYSKSEAGHDLGEAFAKEYKDKYEPFEKAFEKRKAEAATIAIPDESRLGQYGQILEKGMKEVGTDSPIYKLYDHWGERLLAKDTVAGVDQLKSELGNEISKAERAADYNTSNALKNIRNTFSDFQESQIAGQGRQLEKMGVRGAEELSEGLLNERAELNRKYSTFAKMSNELLDHVGAGNFKGAGTLLKKVESVGAEGLLNKFSVKNNADFIPFLEQHFPETLAHVRQNELKQLIQPAINSAKGESPVNVAKLADILKKTMAGKKELAEFALSPQAIEKIQAAQTLLDAIPKTKDSGTPGGLAKLLKGIPSSAMAAVAMVTGHNPAMGAVIGHVGEKLGRDLPDATRLAYLKFLGSNQPIKAEGFKAAVDFLQASAKGQTMLSKGAKALFKSGAQVIPDHAFPTQAENDKLDKHVERLQKNPEKLLNAANGDVGHYMPDHQSSLAASQTRATQYLQSIKPQPHKLGPLDKEVPPQPSEVARYNRALTIANNPNVVLDHIKSGTLQSSDIKDLTSMYPATYNQMLNKIQIEMTNAHANEEAIPYKTRMGISLFMGTPVDASMQPSSIIAAQPKPAPQGQQAAGPQSGRKGATSALGKTPSMYKTASQTAESDRANRK